MKTGFFPATFDQLPIVGILRGFTRAETSEIVRAAARGGLVNLEITMNSPSACDQIRDATELAGNSMNIGAGTVTRLDILEAALGAGASFIVTPVVHPDVIRRCRELAIPIFPGAFTPTEIVRAWELGAEMVKVFPADAAGPGYIRGLKGPLPQIKLLPTGGIDLETLPRFLEAGADGFGVGSPLFQKEKVAAKNWSWIEERCRAFALAYRTGKNNRAIRS